MKYAFLVMCLSIAAFTFSKEEAPGKWDFHRSFLRAHYDLTAIKEVWDDDLWHIRCIFVDLDCDGQEEIVSLSVSGEDRTGNVWKIWRVDGEHLKLLREEGEIDFWCGQESYYKMVYRDGSVLGLGLGMQAGYMDTERRKIVKSTPDCVFSVVGREKLVAREIKPNVDAAFRGQEVVSIERLYPEWYFGFDFRPPKDTPHNPQTLHLPYKKPKGDLRPGGGFRAPEGFPVFVSRYRNELQQRDGVSRERITVYAVFLDADNDGNIDCYVTSDAERLAEDVYTWTLYVDREGRMVRPMEPVRPIAGKAELCELPQTVRAGKRSFCRVIRYDVHPYYVILDEASVGKAKIREAITNYSAHRIEKLDCTAYPEL